MSPKSYLILGSNGQLGREFCKVFTRERIQFFAPPENESDITKFELMHLLIEKTLPDVIINCAAYNAVDLAEEQKEKAFLINHHGVENLASLSRMKGINLVHFGTDYVFDGSNKEPYVESDKTNPLSVYGQSKLAGEKAAFAVGGLICRLSWVFGDGTQNFICKLRGWASANPVLKVSDDEVSVPTYTVDIVRFTFLAIEKDLHGLFHLTNSGYASRFELAKYVIEKSGMTNTVVPVPMSTFPVKAQRPKFSPMSNQLISEKLGVEIPDWKSAVTRYLGEKENGKS
jgi:dTDP-4-dehydrorhamnose reductase